MKKILLVIAAFAFFSAGINAQTYGVKGGLNLAQLTNIDIDGDNSETLTSFNAGVFANFGIAPKFSVQPELLYSLQGGKLDELGGTFKYKLSYINLPVMVQYNIIHGLYAEAGPQIGALVDAKVKSEPIGGTSITTSISDELKTIDFSVGFGAGYQFVKIPIGVNVRYTLGITDIAEDDAVPTDDESVKNNVFQIGVFYKFGKMKKK